MTQRETDQVIHDEDDEAVSNPPKMNSWLDFFDGGVGLNIY